MKTERPLKVLGGRYVLEEEIGRGTITTAFRASDRVLDRPVAVKILRPEAADPRLAERFGVAARAAARIAHPGIARVLDTGDAEGRRYVVTELVQGEPLRQVLATAGQLAPDRVTAIGSSLLAALQAAHAAGVVHGRLGPGDVFVCAGDAAKLTDLGLAHGTRAGDLRACGALLYEALTGRPPAQAGARPGDLRPGTPRRLDDAIARATAARPADGFATAEEFRAALSSEDDVAELENAPEGSSFFRRWMLVPFLLAVAVGALIWAGVALGRLQLGGPLGIRPSEPEPTVETTTRLLPIAAVRAFDPLGGDGENDRNAPLAADGDVTTVWRSENYYGGALDKDGVGLLFDLGAAQEVTGFRLVTPAPGFRFEVRVGDDPQALVGSEGSAFTAEEEMRKALPPAEGRYVLLWATSVVGAGDGNRVEVAEFRVVGRGA